MTPERWQRVDEIFQAAIDLNPAQRETFLNASCGGDQDLRSEVESLLSCDEEGLSIIDEPAYQVAAGLLVNEKPQLTEGQQIGHYEIAGLIGKGGMGEVYAAEDTRLKRRIALKLLPTEYTKHKDRLRRFQQEAQTASALNHPNILTIHELGEVDGRQFIATEFVEGDTLRARMKSAPLSLTETLDIATQVASALAAAHKAGIVHRDIKPENIMLRRDGYVKVLDFGLAKLADQREQANEVDVANNIDISSGLLLGTVKYMSPEQARGQQVDPRSDIFSFGVMLYEMVTGCSPFEGRTANDLRSAILNEEPAVLREYAHEAPEKLQNIISKALRKDPQKRYQSAEDLLVDLKELKKTSETPRQRIVDKIKTHKIGATVIITALILVIAVITLVIFKFLPPKKVGATLSGALKITELTNNGKTRDPAISPDGKYVAYVVVDAGQESIWIRQVESDSTAQIVSPAVRLAALTFSRDGNYLYYVKYDSRDTMENALYKVSVQGGDSRKIIEHVHCPISFSPDGRQFAFFRRYDEGENALLIANEDGTGEQELARHKASERFGDYPVGPAWSPDGKVIACAAGNGRGYNNLIEVRIADRSERTITSQDWQGVSGVSWLPEGNGLVVAVLEKDEVSRGRFQIWRVSYPGGDVERLTNDLDGYTFVSSAVNAPFLTAVRQTTVHNIWIVPANNIKPAKQITSGSSSYSGVCWSPEGRVVYSSLTSKSADVWIMDADGTNQQRLTADASDVPELPSVSPNGRYIVFRKLDDSLWRMDIDGSNPKQLAQGVQFSGWLAGTFTPDSRWVVVRLDSGWWEVPIDGGDAVQLQIDKKADRLALSPDGKWIAYRYWDVESNPQPLIIVAPVDGQALVKRFALPVKDEIGNAIKWAGDGRAILFVGTNARISNIWSLPIDGSAPKQLTDFRSEQIVGFDLSPDGKQLACVRANTIADVVLISGIDK